jgi:hypothetical protein
MGRIMAEEVELVGMAFIGSRARACRGLSYVSFLSHVTRGGECLLKNST